MVPIMRHHTTLTHRWRARALHQHVQITHAQGRLLYVHTPKVLGCTPPAIIRHFSFRSAPCHDIRQFTGHMRTKSHIGVYPLSTLPMPNTTATQWCPIGIVIHGYVDAKVEQCAPSPPSSRLPPPSSSSPSLEDSSSSESSHVACTTSLALEAPHLGCGWADSASGGLGGGRKGGRKGRDGSSRGLFLHARPVWRTHTTSRSMPHPSWCHHGPGQYPCAPAWTSTR